VVVAVRSNIETESNLPTFEVVPLTTDAAHVTCPRCEVSFTVTLSVWVSEKVYVKGDGTKVTIFGRPCPYCSKVSRVPEDD